MINYLTSFSGLISAGLLVGLLVEYLFQRFFEKFSLPNLTYKPKVSVKPSQLLLMGSIVLSMVILTFVDTFWGIFLFFVSVSIWYCQKNGERLLENYRKGKILARLSELFPQSLGMFIQALKTGQTVPQVLEYLSQESPKPLKEEFALVCAEMSLGQSAEAALTKMAERFPTFNEFHQFLESYKISRQTGANLTHLLQVLLDGMEEKNRILRKMNAMTSQARLSGMVMGLLPFMLGLVFFVMDPSLMTPLVTTKAGWGILLLAAVLEGIGFLWIRQLLRLEI